MYRALQLIATAVLRRPDRVVPAAVLVVALSACGGGGTPTQSQSDGPTGEQENPEPPSPQPAETMTLRSDAFEDGEPLPDRFTCDGEGVSPPLRWGEMPEGTVELALVVTDPDAPQGEFVHWVVAGLDPATDGIDAGQLPDGAVVGTNDFDEQGYGPPCPPGEDTAHRYVFTVYAAGEPLGVQPGASVEQVRDALRGTALADGELVGTYSR